MQVENVICNIKNYFGVLKSRLHTADRRISSWERDEKKHYTMKSKR